MTEAGQKRSAAGRLIAAAGYGSLAWLMASTSALAAEAAWNQAGQGNWTTDSNWTPAGAPTASSYVVIDNGGEAQITTAGQASSTLTIGATDAGTLTITSGGTLTTAAPAATVVGGAGTGALAVTRSGSNWVNDGDLTIGASADGSGTLTIDLGATAETTGDTVIGQDAGASGTASVDGQGSSWTSDGSLTIAADGSGTLTVSSAGTLSDAAATLGSGSTGSGTAKVTGTGSSWTTAGTLTIGGGGTGSLTVEAAGSASAGDIVLGADAQGSGTFKVTGAGSSLAATNAMTIGGAGSGDATVESGGTLSSATATLGDAATGSGTLKVTGTGSSWTTTGQTTIGKAGTGDVTIEAGASAETGDTTLGSAAGSVGTAKITGGGSTWTVDGALTAGDAGTGTITIDTGGGLASSGTILGASAGGVGTIQVTGAGSDWTDSGAVTIGASGDGVLQVFAGATATTGATTVAEAAGSTGSVAVTGVGSSWTTTGDVTIGASGDGSLTIADGGAVSIGNGSGTLTLAENAGSTGTLQIGNDTTSGTLQAAEIAGGAGTATIRFAQSDDFTLAAKVTGTTSIEQTGSGTTLLASTNTYTGTTDISAGTLKAGASNALGTNSDVTVAAAGTLDLAGYDQTIGALDNQGLVSLVGNSAGTTLTVDGDLTGGGTIALATALGGSTSETDSLHVTGDVTGSTFLKVTNLGGDGARTTGDGIQLVSVDGASSSDSFTLGRTIAGAWAYYLYYGGIGDDAADGNWYLRSELSSTAQTYRAYPRALLNIDRDAIGTLADRRGASVPSPDAAGGRGASWIRVVGTGHDESPDQGSAFRQVVGLAQAGYENDLGSSEAGTLSAGAILTVGRSQTKVDTLVQGVGRQGRIDTTTAGIGGNLTWRGTDGTYVDAVAQLLLHDSGISTDDGGTAKSDALALGATASLEVGRKFDVGNGFALTPQAQLLVSTIGTQGFTDADGAAVHGAFNTELLGRSGLRLDYSGSGTQGFAGPWTTYAIVNLAYAFMGRTAIDVGTTELDQGVQGLRGEVGLGGTLRLSDRIRLYGQGAFETAFDGSGSRWQAGAGLDIRW